MLEVIINTSSKFMTFGSLEPSEAVKLAELILRSFCRDSDIAESIADEAVAVMKIELTYYGHTDIVVKDADEIDYMSIEIEME